MRLSRQMVISIMCLLLAASAAFGGSAKQSKNARQMFEKKMAGEQQQLLGLLSELLTDGYEISLAKVDISKSSDGFVAAGSMDVQIKPQLYQKLVGAFDENFGWEDDEDDNMVTFDGVVDDDLIEDILEDANLDQATDDGKLVHELQNSYRKHRQLLGIYLQNTNDARIRFFLVARDKYGDELFRVDMARKVSQARSMTRLRFRYLGPELVFQSNSYTRKYKLDIPFNPGPDATYAVVVGYQTRAEETLYSQGKLRAGEGEYEPFPARAKLQAGLLNYNSDNFVTAESAFKAATELDPNLPEAFAGLGLSLMAQDKYKDGEAALARAHKLRQSPGPWLAAARLLGEKKDKKAAASCLSCSDQGLKIEKSAELLSAAARCALNKSDFKQALAFAEQGIELGETAALHALAGLAQLGLRKKKDAQTSLEKAKNLNIEDTALGELAQKLKVKLK